MKLKSMSEAKGFSLKGEVIMLRDSLLQGSMRCIHVHVCVVVSFCACMLLICSVDD